MPYGGHLADEQDRNHDRKCNDRNQLILPCQPKKNDQRFPDLLRCLFPGFGGALVVLEYSRQNHADHPEHEQERSKNRCPNNPHVSHSVCHPNICPDHERVVPMPTLVATSSGTDD